MEEKNEQKKLSYEELSKVASDLHIQYQKLMEQYQKAMKALNDREFDYMSFFLQMLFKVIEHADMYEKDFIEWTTKNIQNIIVGFANNMQKEPENKEESEK